jgi:hypothetical protein
MNGRDDAPRFTEVECRREILQALRAQPEQHRTARPIDEWQEAVH